MPEARAVACGDAERASASAGAVGAAGALGAGMGGQAAACGDAAVDRAIAALPAAESTWPGISSEERERRRLVLADIATRIREDGPRAASFDPDRGRLFMPFSASKAIARWWRTGKTLRLTRIYRKRHLSATSTRVLG